MNDCPTESRLVAWAEDGADAVVRTHLETCAACRQVVAAMLEDEREVQLAPGDTLGRYRLDALVSRGGMGVVFRAWDPTLSREVAIKVLRRDLLLSGSSEQLMQEARTMARLSHPNLVSVFDAASERGQFFVVMEWLESGTLRAWLAQKRTPHELLTAFLAAGRGLAAAHAAGLSHGDFKPENVLISRDGHVKVGDLGMSDLSAITAQEGALLAGTPRYMAPELGTSGPTPASDQYAFAVALSDALEGHHAPRSRKVLARALEPDPTRRYDSMLALLTALEPRSRSRWRLAAALAATALVALVPIGLRQRAQREQARVSLRQAQRLGPPSSLEEVRAREVIVRSAVDTLGDLSEVEAVEAFELLLKFAVAFDDLGARDDGTRLEDEVLTRAALGRARQVSSALTAVEINARNLRAHHLEGAAREAAFQQAQALVSQAPATPRLTAAHVRLERDWGMLLDGEAAGPHLEHAWALARPLLSEPDLEQRLEAASVLNVALEEVWQRSASDAVEGAAQAWAAVAPECLRTRATDDLRVACNSVRYNAVWAQSWVDWAVAPEARAEALAAIALETQVHPDSEWAWRLSVDSHLTLCQPGVALAASQRLLQFDGSVYAREEALLAAALAGDEASFERLAAAHAPERWVGHFAAGLHELSRGRRSEALASFERLQAVPWPGMNWCPAAVAPEGDAAARQQVERLLALVRASLEGSGSGDPTPAVVEFARRELR